LDGAVTEETVGAVRSIVIVVDVSVALLGTLLLRVSVAVPCNIRGVTVPGEQPLTVTVKVVPELALNANEHPVEVPALSKSDDETPLTESENTKVKVMGEDVLVGVT
jgi:hypothetical protein